MLLIYQRWLATVLENIPAVVGPCSEPSSTADRCQALRIEVSKPFLRTESPIDRFAC